MRNLLTVLLLLICHCAIGQYSFEYTIASDEDDALYTGLEDSSSNIILTGRIGNWDNNIWNPYILKIYPNGDTLSKRISGADTSGWFQIVEVLNDGNYMFLGQCVINNNYDFLWVCKTDTALNILFQKMYKMSTDFYFNFVYANSFIDKDQNIVISGSASYYPDNSRNYHNDIAFAKLNQQGDTLLTKIHHYQFSQRVYSMHQIPNTSDCLCIAGLFGYHNYGPVRFDSAFNLIDMKHYYNMMDSPMYSHWLTDTSYLFTSIRSYDTKDTQEIGVYHVDTALNYIAGLELGKADTSDYPAWRQSIGYANDTTIYIGGTQIYMGFWLTIPNVLELYVIDKELNLLGQKDFGSGDANYNMWGLIPTSDMGCLMFGTRYSEKNNGHENDIHIIKIRREDIEIATSPITATQEMFKVYNLKAFPNPASDVVNIPFTELGEIHGARLLLFNRVGKKILDKPIVGNGNAIQVDVTNLAPGMYIYAIHAGKTKYATGKFIKK